MNKTFSLTIIITTFLLILIINLNNNPKTTKEVLNTSISKSINIIHQQKIGKGTIIFYNYFDKKDVLITSFVKKGIFGYKSFYDCYQGDVDLVINKYGLTYLYVPEIETISPPVYFGIIGNSNINKVKIIDTKNNKAIQAKIINANDTIIWFVSMNGFQGSEYEIIGLSSKGKELTRIRDDISQFHSME